MIAPLHWGQVSSEATRTFGLGDSWLAIHSRRQGSCAVREQEHGLRHGPSSAPSSVSSCWQIQQMRASSGTGGGVADPGTAEVEDAVDASGWLRGIHCDSAMSVSWGGTSSVGEEARGEDERRREGWEGKEVIFDITDRSLGRLRLLHCAHQGR